MAQRMGSSSRRSLVSRVLPIVEKDPTMDRVDAIESIDDDLAASTSNVCSRTRITEVHLDELDTPQTHWSSILGEYVKLTGAGGPPSKVRVVNLPDVRALLNVLENSSLPELTIYLMLVPLSEFFILEGKVHHLESASVDGTQDSVAMTCVRALELLFGGHYCHWLWTHVHSPATRSDVRRMWEQVWQETHRLINFRREILVDHNASAPPVENDACQPGFLSPTSHQSRELTVLPSQYSGDFVSNVILFSQKSSKGRRGCQPFLSPKSLDMKWSDRETFFRLLVPDFYHNDATEVAVNYATLGFFLSKSAIRAQLPSNWNWTVYGSCLVGYVRSRLGLVPPVERWRLLVQRQWATQVALRAAALQDDRVNISDVMKRLFLLRLQHTCCSLADRDDASDSDILQTTCNVVTMSVPQFADAFECQNLPQLDCDS
ncbi:uncharacterized protein LOC142768885 [Rhipicephalus microplus]|uniref:uncharacterized protein LOC142768885 n=1 Tax=Rhipicephalus microplus TaxID=6941 RepID=UPI003F6A7CF1